MSIGDTVVVYEDSYANYASAAIPSWVSKYSANQFYHIIYGASGSTAMSQALSLAEQRNAGYVYITDDTLSNPYDTLPSYFSSETSLACVSGSSPSPTPIPSPSPTATSSSSMVAVPSSMSISVGTYAGSVSSLAKANEGSVVNLYTNTKGNLTATFTIPASNLSSNLQLQARFLQLTGSDTFTFKYKNSSGSFVSLGSTTGSAGSYKSLSYALSSSAIVNGTITIRLVSSSGANDCKLDYLAVSGAGGSVTPTPTPSPAPTVISSGGGSATSIPAGTSWYWQLSGTVNTTRTAKVYDIDMYDTSAATIAQLKASGHIVICYFSAGTYENWRSDASQFPAAAIGNAVQGWAGENWLDTRNATVRSIMAARMDLAKSKGCDGLEPDNVDGYANNPGFPLTTATQIDYDSYLASQAHARGMVVALKNATDLVTSLVNNFDFAVVEQCFQYNECSFYSPFISQNKAVLEAEYKSYSSATCSQANSIDFSTAFYNLNLDGSVYQPCW
jgi:hypothetical protein